VGDNVLGGVLVLVLVFVGVDVLVLVLVLLLLLRDVAMVRVRVFMDVRVGVWVGERVAVGVRVLVRLGVRERVRLEVGVGVGEGPKRATRNEALLATVLKRVVDKGHAPDTDNRRHWYHPGALASGTLNTISVTPGASCGDTATTARPLRTPVELEGDVVREGARAT